MSYKNSEENRNKNEFKILFWKMEPKSIKRVRKKKHKKKKLSIKSTMTISIKKKKKVEKEKKSSGLDFLKIDLL